MSNHEMFNSTYDLLVWKNARIVAKLLHKMKLGTLTAQTIYGELANMGLTVVEFNTLITSANDAEYSAETMDHDDGSGFEANVPFDIGTYEFAKDAFRRIYKDSI